MPQNAAALIDRHSRRAPIGEDNMSNLVLEMRSGDMMVVNGAAIRFRGKTRIELTAHARFLFGRQIMPPAEADSPARRIYYALQTAYIGDEDERRPRGSQASERRIQGSHDLGAGDGVARPGNRLCRCRQVLPGAPLGTQGSAA
jgi:hypothetical protein